MRRYKMIDVSARKLIAARYAENARVADIADEVGVTTAAVYRAFCDKCAAENCPNNDQRNNPGWWLKMEEEG